MGKVVHFSKEPSKRMKKDAKEILDRIWDLTGKEMDERPEEVEDAIAKISEADRERFMFYGATLFCLSIQFKNETEDKEVKE